MSPDELARSIDPAADSMLDYFEFLRRHGDVTWWAVGSKVVLSAARKLAAVSDAIEAAHRRRHCV